MNAIIDQMSSKEFAVESRLASILSDVSELDQLRRDNEGRVSLIGNVDCLEEARNRISGIVEDLRGLS